MHNNIIVNVVLSVKAILIIIHQNIHSDPLPLYFFSGGNTATSAWSIRMYRLHTYSITYIIRLCTYVRISIHLLLLVPVSIRCSPGVGTSYSFLKYSNRGHYQCT